MLTRRRFLIGTAILVPGAMLAMNTRPEPKPDTITRADLDRIRGALLANATPERILVLVHSDCEADIRELAGGTPDYVRFQRYLPQGAS